MRCSGSPKTRSFSAIPGKYSLSWEVVGADDLGPLFLVMEGHANAIWTEAGVVGAEEEEGESQEALRLDPSLPWHDEDKDGGRLPPLRN